MGKFGAAKMMATAGRSFSLAAKSLQCIRTHSLKRRQVLDKFFKTGVILTNMCNLLYAGLLYYGRISAFCDPRQGKQL